jgi:DNA repair protein RecO (recombination protein O)
MEWQDEGVIIGLKRHGESAMIVEVMTRDHGRHMGLVQGGRSRRLQSVLQQGNGVQCLWRARLEDHLGHLQVEVIKPRAAMIINAPVALYGIHLISSHVRLLAERDPHPALYDTLNILLDHIEDRDIAPALMVRFELALLSELGFGLDLSSCAATGSTQNLIYVSPKSGRAVSAEAGAPWADRLLALPRFLRPNAVIMDVSEEDLSQGFTLTGFFLNRDVLVPRGLSGGEARAAFLAFLAQKARS